jgi:hypothetical protein
LSLTSWVAHSFCPLLLISQFTPFIPSFRYDKFFSQYTNTNWPNTSYIPN